MLSKMKTLAITGCVVTALLALSALSSSVEDVSLAEFKVEVKESTWFNLSQMSCPGNDIEGYLGVRKTSLADCESLCEGAPYCRALEYNSRSELCWCKWACSWKHAGDTDNSISYKPPLQPDWYRLEKTRCPGNDIEDFRGFKQDSLESCEAACDGVETAHALEYQHWPQLCWCKTSCPPSKSEKDEASEDSTTSVKTFNPFEWDRVPKTWCSNTKTSTFPIASTEACEANCKSRGYFGSNHLWASGYCQCANGCSASIRRYSKDVTLSVRRWQPKPLVWFRVEGTKCDGYDLSIDIKNDGMPLRTNLENLEDCENFCRSMPECTAVQWNDETQECRRKAQCYPSNRTNAKSNFTISMKSLESETEPQWYRVEKTHCPGNDIWKFTGIQQDSFHNCEFNCNGVPGAQALEWQQWPKKCWCKTACPASQSVAAPGSRTSVKNFKIRSYNRSYNRIQEKVIVGNIVGHMKVELPSLEACEIRCDGVPNSRCAGYNHRMQQCSCSTKCELSSLTYHPDFTSSLKAEWFRVEDKKCNGNDLDVSDILSDAIESGKDADFSILTRRDLEDCEKWCGSKPECTAVQWDDETRRCLRKATCYPSNRTNATRNFVISMKSLESEPDWYRVENKRCPESETIDGFRRFKQNSLESCESTCYGVKTANALEYLHSSKDCWCKRACPPSEREGLEGTTTSVKNLKSSRSYNWIQRKAIVGNIDGHMKVELPSLKACEDRCDGVPNSRCAGYNNRMQQCSCSTKCEISSLTYHPDFTSSLKADTAYPKAFKELSCKVGAADNSYVEGSVCGQTVTDPCIIGMQLAGFDEAINESCEECFLITLMQDEVADERCTGNVCPAFEKTIMAQVQTAKSPESSEIPGYAGRKFDILPLGWKQLCPFVCDGTNGVMPTCVASAADCKDKSRADGRASALQTVAWKRVVCGTTKPDGNYFNGVVGTFPPTTSA